MRTKNPRVFSDKLAKKMAKRGSTNQVIHKSTTLRFKIRRGLSISRANEVVAAMIQRLPGDVHREYLKDGDVHNMWYDIPSGVTVCYGTLN